MCSKLYGENENPIYAKADLVEMHWGLVPVEYDEDGARRRRIFHVLRVCPQPGLHLLDLLRRKYFQRKNESKRDCAMIREVCHYLQQVVNHEADLNYGMTGVWGCDNPSPWTVNDPSNPTSVQRLLSPFTVLQRILHHLPGAHCGMVRTMEGGMDDSTLKIDGFPPVGSPEDLTSALDLYRNRQELYLSALKMFEYNFFVSLADCAQDPDKDVQMEPVLSEHSQNFRTSLDMVFSLTNFMRFSQEKLFKDADRIIMPKLGLAIVEYFIYFQLSSSMQSMSACDFIVAHVGEQLCKEVVTETRIATKYRVTDVQSMEDFPKAGQHKDARDGFKRNAMRMRDGGAEAAPTDVEFYHNFMRLQFSATMNGLLMDAWMSDRVLAGAAVMEQLMGDLCPCRCTRQAMEWVWDTIGEASQAGPQMICHDEVCHAWSRLNAAMCKLNVTVKANPLNLALVWGMLKSDVLTFLGLHNQSWRWIMYCMQVAPMFGHLRTQTEDGHASKGECILTAKPNSVGLNDVVVKTVNYCLAELLGYVVHLSEEQRRVLKLDKVDRKTRAGMEASQAVELANDKIISKPTSSKLMQAVAVDEALRSFDENGLAGLINTGLPRDSNAGEGTTTKSLKPEKGYSEKGETRQLPGMGWYVLVFATNTNARNPVWAEMLRTLACGAMITYPPGAPQSHGLSSAMTVRDKRKRGQSRRSNTSMGESMLPADAEHCKHLAYLLSIVGIASRHVGLVNKTAQSNWELSAPVMQYIDAVKQVFFEFFTDFVSQTYTQSCDRQFKGFIARSVAACLMCTVASNFEKYVDPKEAMFESLLCMENGALTLYWANMALLNGFTHLADSGLCVLTQLVRWKADVPVLDLGFLCDALDPDKPIPADSANFQALRRFLERLRNARTRDEDEFMGGFTGSYALVSGMGSVNDYLQVEQYLHKFCGVNTGSCFTYLKILRDASARCIDLTAFFDLPYSMLDVRPLFQRCGVRYDEGWYMPPGTVYEKGTNLVILIPDQQDPKGTSNLGAVWVHVVQLLLLNALIGPGELHADNAIALGKGLMSLVARRCVPQQAIPSMGLVTENFTYKFGEVVNDSFRLHCSRDYFLRSRVCYGAWRSGLVKEMNCLLGAHPLEDVVHIHGWVQAHAMHCGGAAASFYYMPKGVPRPPELVPGRIYPLLSETGGNGTVCVCPEGKAFALIALDGEQPQAVAVDRWQLRLAELSLQVAPLVHRPHAVLRVDGALGTLLAQSPSLPTELAGWEDHFDAVIHPASASYLDYDGSYRMCVEDTVSSVDWRRAHSMLVPLGAHVLVSKAALRDRLAGRATLRQGNYSHVRGWLRYPDECDDELSFEHCIFVAFRVSREEDNCDEACVLAVPQDACRLADDEEASLAIADGLWP